MDKYFMEDELHNTDNIRSLKYNFKSDIINNLVFKPVIATGGIITDIVQDNINYRVHTFLENGTFVCTSPGEVEYLIVAGGGGGGDDGGGGAGGYRCSVPGELSGGNSLAEPLMNISIGNYSVIVGNGGAGGPDNGFGIDGSNSSFNSIVSIGGGGGGAYKYDGKIGGSGSGAGGTGSGGNGTLYQGCSGGKAYSISSPYNAGGGGGAGGSGSNGNSSAGGNGGDGLISNITGTPIARGSGGFGWGQYNCGIKGVGEIGSGGNGKDINGEAGSAGIVIIRYKI